MTEQERKKAFENQRRNAERRAKEADGTYDMERRIQYEKNSVKNAVCSSKGRH